jgi:hypothetical protein
LFINNPEKDPKGSISLNAIYISSLDVQNKVVSSASCDILMLKEEKYIAYNEIEPFGSFSGLLINKNKTGGIWVGKLKHSKDKIEGIK